MQKKVLKHLEKRTASIILALSMIATSVGAMLLPVAHVKASELKSIVKYIDFDSAEVENQDFFVTDGGNTDCEINYNDTKFTATASDWGNDWGGESLWEVQQISLIPVTTGEKYTVSFTAQADAACTFKLKVGDKANDSTTYVLEDIAITAANTPQQFSFTTSSAVDIEKLMVLFALGGVTGATKITVSNLSLKNESNKYIDVREYIDLDPLSIEHPDYVDGGANTQIQYTNSSVTMTATDWGNDWGAGNPYGTQQITLVPVTTGETYTVGFTAQADAACSFTIKLGDKANNDTTYALDSVVIAAADTPQDYTFTTNAVVTIEKLMVLFAAGNVTDATEIIISDLYVKKVVAEGASDTSVGTDYYTPGADHTGDVADPGKTKADYELIWNDEFDGNYGAGANIDPDTGLNLDNWFCQPGDGSVFSNPGWGNQELQCYTDRPENVGVNEHDNGLLRITAKYEEDGYTYADESKKYYTSARLASTTLDKALFNTTYGHIESRISLPETKGTWPAFWMLPQSTDIYGGWPVSGEIDILETVGINTDKACGTLHWGAPEHVYKGSGYVELGSAISNFHTYAIDWEPGKITWIYDGEPIYTSTNWESAFSGASDSLTFDAPFDQPFYVLLNLAVDSGNFGGAANKATFQGETNMYVDYVRVYQKTAGYADSVERTASDGIQDDWADYAGENQIADLTAASVTQAMTGGTMADATSEASKWYLSYQSDATDATIAPYTDANSKDWAKVGITTKGAQNYSVQLIGHYNAKAGYVYKVSFDSYAEGNMIGKTVNCDSKEWSGWSTYGIQSFALTAEPTSTSFLFEQTEDFDNCRIEFNVGAQDSGTVYFGNVKVEIVDPESIAQEEAVRKPLANGDVIYNGTFDQGSKHFGYWTAMDNTNVSIPRYTTEKLTAEDVSVIDVASKTNYENISDGVKYYERRAMISPVTRANGTTGIYQAGLKMPADSYKLKLDMYSSASTTVKAAIYSTKTTGETVALDKLILSKDLSYDAAQGVKGLEWQFKLDTAVDEAALVLTFADGRTVQIDNVSLVGDSLAEKVEPNPVNSETTWTGDNGGGTALDVVKNNGVYTLNNVTSGTTWYSPQIVSNDFALTTAKEYKLTFKYKLSGESNNTFQYILQENGGSWGVYNNGPTKVTYDAAKADADGFCTYEVTFTADKTLPNVHMVFGLGGSEAAGNAAFSFKDVDLRLSDYVDGDGDGEGEGGQGEGGTGSGSGAGTGTGTGTGNNNMGNAPTGDANFTWLYMLMLAAASYILVVNFSKKDRKANN